MSFRPTAADRATFARARDANPAATIRRGLRLVDAELDAATAPNAALYAELDDWTYAAQSPPSTVDVVALIRADRDRSESL